MSLFAAAAGKSSPAPGVEYKIIVIGPSMAGKTSLINRFVNKSFAHEVKHTTGVDFLKRFMDNGDVLQLWDIAGQDRYHRLYRAYFEGATAAICVFDCSNDLNEAAQLVERWKRELDERVVRHDGSPLPAVLVFNKVDLVPRTATHVQNKLIELSRLHMFKACYLTSALTGEGVSDPFEAAHNGSRQSDAPLVVTPFNGLRINLNEGHDRKKERCAC
jgi:small GTP-binding protein